MRRTIEVIVALGIVGTWVLVNLVILLFHKEITWEGRFSLGAAVVMCAYFFTRYIISHIN